MKKTIFIYFTAVFCSVMFGQEQENLQYDIRNLSTNTKYSDFGISFTAKGEAVFASSKGGGKKWKTNNEPYLNLFQGIIEKDSLVGEINSLSSEINSVMHESNAVFSADGKTVYFTRNNILKGKKRRDKNGWNNLKIYKATVGVGNEWGNIKELPFNNDAYSVGHPALNQDETILYFTSDMPGGIGKTDLWKVDILEEGTFGSPENLGDQINSSNREMFPVINNNILYFSSNGHRNNIGGLDIYKAEITSNGFENIKSVGVPLNSAADDFSFVQTNGSAEIISGYFSSNRPGGKGNDDIYYFEQIPPIIEICEQYVKGEVIDEKTFKPIPGAVVTLSEENGVVVKQMKVDQQGKYSFTILCKENYHITAEKEQYSSIDKYFFASDEQGLVVNLSLEKDDFINVGDKVLVNINPIYFDFDDAEIRQDASYELNKVIAVMKKYPNLIIESGSHTDSRGNDYYNIKLSSRRALSTVKYITSHGISPDRITGQGYGEKMLTNNCFNGVECSETEHQLNRRTEFVILNPEILY